MADKPRRKLTIVGHELEFEGTSRKTNKPFKLYNVTALDEAGMPIDLRLQSFEEFPVGELIEFQVEKRDDERHGTTYTLTRPGSGPGLKESVDELRGRVNTLEEQVAALMSRLPSGPTAAPPGGPPAAGPSF